MGKDAPSAGMTLPMADYLAAVAEHGVHAPESLMAEGYPMTVIYAKAEKAARKHYTDYGVAPHRGWLTSQGRTFLSR